APSASPLVPPRRPAFGHPDSMQDLGPTGTGTDEPLIPLRVDRSGTMSWPSARATRPGPGDRHRPGLAGLRTVGQGRALALASVLAVVALAGVTLTWAAAVRGRQQQAVEDLIPAVRAIGLAQDAFAVLPVDYRAVLDAPTDKTTLMHLSDVNTRHAVTAM